MNRPTGLISCLVAACLIAGVAFAQAPPPQRPAPTPEEAVLGKLLDQYATVAGGWYLEQRCSYFATNLRAEFEWNIAQSTVALGRKVPPAMLMTMQQSAKEVADKHSCGPATENLVLQTLTLSRQTVHVLTGQRYDDAAQQRYTAERIRRLLIAQQADTQCKMMPPDIRASFDGSVTRAISKFEQTTGAAVIKQVRDSAAAAYKSTAPPCDNNLRQFLQAMAAEARQISGPQ